MTLSAHARAMDEQPNPADPDSQSGTIFTPHRRTQALVLAASILCFLLFWWGGALLGVPAERGFQGSLLAQPNWPLALLATYLMLGVAVVIGSAIAGRAWFFGGLFAATIGLMALSIRGGPVRYVLFDAAAHGAAQRVFGRLLLEQCLLFVPIALLWMFFWRRYQAAIASIQPAGNEKKSSGDAGGHASTAMALLAQVAIMGVIILLLTPTDAKKQALVSVFVAALVGTALAEYFTPDDQAPAWFWVGPFIVGAVGYLTAWFNATPWTTGTPNGALANLAQLLPLDYASAGCAGALLGYWMSGARANAVFSLRSGNHTPAGAQRDLSRGA